jgi:hypothetical protein
VLEYDESYLTGKDRYLPRGKCHSKMAEKRVFGKTDSNTVFRVVANDVTEVFTGPEWPVVVHPIEDESSARAAAKRRAQFSWPAVPVISS